MENGKILDGQISASSEHSGSLAAIHGRLHYQGPQGNDGAWAASTNDFHQWLQIDLGSQFFKVKGVATQGRQNVMQYVTKYKLQYSNNGLNFKFYREEGSYENKVRLKALIKKIVFNKVTYYNRRDCPTNNAMRSLVCSSWWFHLCLNFRHVNLPILFFPGFD